MTIHKILLNKYLIEFNLKAMRVWDHFFSKKDPSFISFMHCSDEYREFFTSKDDSRPTFYWFTDRYYEHVACGKNPPAYRYFYFFIKDPSKDKISLRARHSPDFGFHDMFDFYNFYKIKQVVGMIKKILGVFHYNEPGIINSFDHMKPDLIARYYESINDFAVIKPDKYKRMHLNIFNKKTGKVNHFFNTNLSTIFPNLKQALPFKRPRIIDGKYYYKNWINMKGHSGWWL